MLSEFAVNEEVTSFFFIPEVPQVRKNKRGKDYLCLKLQDRTGIADGRIWDYQQGFDPNTIVRGSFVKIRGQVGEWNDQTQVSISQIRLVEESDEVDVGDFFERSIREPAEMFEELLELLNGIQDKYLHGLLSLILENNKEAFCKAPAAKSVHHCFIGGLLEHVLSLCHAAVAVSELYSLNVDLMLTSCVLHDIGKLRELSYDAGISYSLEGTLLGHISIGMGMAAKAMDSIHEFPQALRIAVLHLIAAHHGLLAWGSPKVPMMREAIAFHLIDNLDSKMAICNRALKGDLNPDGLTAWVKEMEAPIWRGPVDYAA